MQSLFSIRFTSLALSFLLLTGCAEFNAAGNENPSPHNDAPVQSDFDELLAFAANMSRMPASSRTDACHALLKQQKDAPETGVQLHLLVGRLLSDACGDIPKILTAVTALPPGSLSDERMQQLVAVYAEALKRLQSVSKKAATLERRKKSLLESKDANRSKKDEARLLREKLEALRSMEKHLDESGDAN